MTRPGASRLPLQKGIGCAGANEVFAPAKLAAKRGERKPTQLDLKRELHPKSSLPIKMMITNRFALAMVGD